MLKGKHITLNHTQSKHFLKQFQETLLSKKSANESHLSEVLSGLLDVYFDRVPDAARVFDLLSSRNDTILNDHIAFRSLSVIPLLKIFLPYGYKVQFDDNEKQIPFNFVSKKLTAVWLKHPNPIFPRIFISEIRLNELPKSLYDQENHKDIPVQSIINNYLTDLNDPIDSIDPTDTKRVVNYLHTRLWKTPTYTDYADISKVSEYLAWVLYNDFYLNHFTVSINSLKSMKSHSKIESIITEYRHLNARIDPNNLKDKNTLYHYYLEKLESCYKMVMMDFNHLLEKNKFALNTVNNRNLNISDDKLLLQSSTKASLIMANFSDGSFEIPGSYVEFAYRGLLKETALQLLDGERFLVDLETNDYRDGFETKNANAIFESTYVHTLDAPVNETPIGITSFNRSKEKLASFLDKYQTEHPELSIFTN